MSPIAHTRDAPERAAPWGPALLLVAVAWAFVPLEHLPDFDSLKTLVLLGGVALLTALPAIRADATPTRDRDPLLVGPCVLALFALIVVVAARPRGSLEGPLLAVGALAAARLVAAIPDGRAALRTVARGASIAALGAGLYALAQVTGIDPTPWGARRDVVSTFGNTSFAAEFQAAAIPLGLWLALASGSRRVERVLGAAAVALALTHLALANSRIDLIALAAALTVGGYRLLEVLIKIIIIHITSNNPMTNIIKFI